VKRPGHTRQHDRPIVYLIGNAHLDPVWLWRWQEGFAEAKATFRSALDRMTETPGYIFTCSSAAVYEWVEENDPSMFSEIQRRVRQGRWVPAGGWWIEPDCNIPSGESFVRQGLYGQRYFREKFGHTCTVGYCIDSFGHAGSLPKFLNGCGMTGYIFMRPGQHENADIPQIAFRWQTDDGSEVTTLRIPGNYNTSSPGALEEKIRSNLAIAAGTPLRSSAFAMYGVGNHGGGPTRTLLAAIEGWRKDRSRPRLAYASPETVVEVANTCRLPIWKSEMQHHAPGCYSAVSMVKAYNRRAEEALLSAERWGVAARIATGRASATGDLARAWKHVLFNQFHDIMAGTSVVGAYEDARNQLGGAVHTADFAANSARQAVSWSIDTTGDSPPLVVFNNQPFAFRGVVETEDLGFGRSVEPALSGNHGPIPHQAVEPHTICGRRRCVAHVEIPALGYTLLRRESSAQASSRRLLGRSAVRCKGLTIENDRLRVSLDRRGYLAIYDRVQRRQVFEGAGGIPLVIEDPSDTWSHGIEAYRKVIGRFRKASASLVEAGPVRASLGVTYAWGDSLLTLDYLLGAGEPFVTVRGRVDWREQWKTLKLAFPVPYRPATWTSEIPSGTITRPLSGNEEPIQQWVDISDGSRGLSIANDSKYSCSVEPGEVRITILRSPPYAYHIPHSSQNDAQHAFTDQGPQEFGLALVPHGGDWREAGIIEIARQLNCPPVVLAETFHGGPLPPTAGFVSCSGKGIYIGAIKEHERGRGVVVRATEWFGKRRKATFGIPALGRSWTATFRKGEIKTFFLPYDRRSSVREVNMLEDTN